MKKSRLIAVSIGSVLGLALIVGGFLFMQTFSRASSEKPENITISEVTATSAKVSWTTGNDTVGAVVKYGVSPTSMTQFAPATTPQGKEHSVVISALTPSTTYSFVLTAGADETFDNAGVPWSFTTKSENETTTDVIGSPTPTPTEATTTTSETPIEDRVNTCKETDCEAIKAKLGTECSTQEYIKCIKAAQNPSPSN